MLAPQLLQKVLLSGTSRPQLLQNMDAPWKGQSKLSRQQFGINKKSAASNRSMLIADGSPVGPVCTASPTTDG
jgi:hypothetical protein